jgi:hypothetical protein
VRQLQLQPKAVQVPLRELVGPLLVLEQQQQGQQVEQQLEEAVLLLLLLLLQQQKRAVFLLPWEVPFLPLPPQQKKRVLTTLQWRLRAQLCLEESARCAGFL